jgi:hypothetical protein
VPCNKTLLALLGALSVSGALLGVRDARACGGCFHPPPHANDVVDTVVTEHRMALALSPTQSVLWDQIRYSGSPSEFAWVLPVQPGTRVELSNDAWLAALDANTATIVEPPPQPYCPPPPGNGGGFDTPSGGPSSPATDSVLPPRHSGCDCTGFGAAPSGSDFASGGDDGSAGTDATDFGAGSSGVGGFASGSSGGPPPPPPVTVQVQETVGPYAVVILHSSMGEALDAWLLANGFEIPANIQPILDAYVAQGLDFVALKLRPGANVDAMRPVRVIEPGADPSLPLRMISAGTGSHVGLTLWVISEGRYQPQNFPNVTVDFTQLAYDVLASRSNYAELRAAALASGGAPSDAGVGVEGSSTVDAGAAEAASEAQASDAPVESGGDALAADGSIEAAAGDAGDDGGAATGAWVTEFAGHVNLSGLATGMTNPGLLVAYQKACTPSTPVSTCDSGPDMASTDGAPASDAVAVLEASSADGGDDGEAGPVEASVDDAGSAPDAGADAQPPAVCVPPAPVVCDDVDVAFTGLHTGSIWVTRLVADLPSSALGQDLVLEAAPTQTNVSNLHQARTWIDGDPCTLSVSLPGWRLPAPGKAGNGAPGSGPATESGGCALASRGDTDTTGICAILGAAGVSLTRWGRRRKRGSTGRLRDGGPRS